MPPRQPHMNYAEAFKKIVKSKLFKDVLKVLIAFASGYASSGCAGVQKTPALAAFECRAAVLAPYVGEAANVLVPQIASGERDPGALLYSLGLSPRDIADVAAAYRACEPEAAPAVEVPADAGVSTTPA